MNPTTAFLPILVGFLGSFESPITLVTNLCAPPGQLIQFNQYLTTHHPIMIRHLQSLTQLDEPNEHQVLVILNLSCKGIKEQITQESTKRHLNFSYRWLLINSEDIYSTQQRAMDIFSDVEILHLSEIYFFDIQKANYIIEFKRVYRNSLATPLILESVYIAPLENPSAITWTRRDPSLVASRLLPPGLNGTLIRATMSIVHNDSLNHLWDYQDRHVDTVTKVNHMLTHAMISFINATVTVSPVSGWGYLNNVTGEYTGMTGQLLNNEADIAASAFFCNLIRLPTIQYISMSSPSKLMFLFQSPKLTMTDNVFLLPFQWVSV